MVDDRSATTATTDSSEGVDAPKRSRPVWLIVLIVIVVVCCCCAALAVPIAWFAGDSALEMLVLARVTAFAALA